MTPQEIINQYIETGIVLAETSMNGDYKRGNAIAKKNRNIYELYLETDKEIASQILSQVMESGVDNARSLAATDALRLNIMIEKSVNVLEEVGEREDMVGFLAKTALKVWKGEVPNRTL